MDGTQNEVDHIEMGLRNTDINKTNEDNAGNTDESSLEIPTFGFTEKSWKTDFVLIVEGTRLYINKAILYIASPVFETMFQSGFKESSCDELELPEKKLRDVVDFLRYIYPSTSAQMTPESAFNVLPLAEEYQVLQLKQRCETALLDNVSEDTPVEELFRILRVACFYNLVNLRKECVQMACMMTQEDVDEAFENNPPPAEAAKEILEQLNKKLREAFLEQKLLIGQATVSNGILKAKNIKQEREMAILEQYLWSVIKENKIFSLDSDYTWKKYTAVFDIDITIEEIKSERQVNIWKVPILICVSKRVVGNDTYLHIDVRNTGDNILSKLKGRAIIVNRQPQGKNETVFINDSFSKYYQYVRQNLMTISKVREIGNGFLSDGHIGIIVHIYMSEPNKG